MTMSSNDISILGIFVVQGCKLPTCGQSLLVILEFGNPSENSNLLNKILKGACVDRETRVPEIFDSSLFFLLQLSNPDVDDFLELGSYQIAERSILGRTTFNDSVTEGLTQIRKLFGGGIGTKSSH